MATAVYLLERGGERDGVTTYPEDNFGFARQPFKGTLEMDSTASPGDLAIQLTLIDIDTLGACSSCEDLSRQCGNSLYRTLGICEGCVGLNTSGTSDALSGLTGHESQ